MEPSKTNYRFPKEDRTKWFDHLTEKGFVVIQNVITSEDCDKALNGIRQYLAKFSPKKLKVEDESSFSEGGNYPPGMEHGINSIIAHPKFLWEFREKVAPIFAQLFECEVKDLVTSFGSFIYADGRRGFKQLDPLDYLHTDQSPKRPGFWMAQGQLNLVNSNEQAGGLIVLPGSHKKHKEIHQKFGLGEMEPDLYEFKPPEIEQLRSKDFIKLCPEAGDLVLFDSRILHSYTLPENPNLRACLLMCQIPRGNIPLVETEKVLEKRTTAWNARKCSRHYPGDRFETWLFEFKVDGEPISNIIKSIAIKDEELSDVQKSLLYVSKK